MEASEGSLKLLLNLRWLFFYQWEQIEDQITLVEFQLKKKKKGKQKTCFIHSSPDVYYLVSHKPYIYKKKCS